MAWPNTPLIIETGLALGADLTADPSTWAYTDITSRTFDRDRESSIVIRRGRQDWATQAEPSSCTLTLDNTNGHFSPRNPLGDYYPDLRRNTPIRVRVNPGTGLDTRFVGHISDLPPRWDPSERHQWVPVTANSSLRRLGQGNDTPLKSALYRAIKQGTQPLAWWPLEDGTDARSAASGLLNGKPLQFSKPELCEPGVPGPGGAASALRITSPLDGTAISAITVATGSVPASSATATSIVIQYRLDDSNQPLDMDQKNGRLYYATGGPTIIEGAFAFQTGGIVAINVNLYDAAGSSIIGAGDGLGVLTDPFDGEWHEVLAILEQNGTGIDGELWYDGELVASDTFASSTIRPPRNIGLFGGDYFDAGTNLIGVFPVDRSHLAVYDTAVAATYTAATGHLGERAGARFTRLGGEEGVPADLAGDDVFGYTMGPQTPTGLLTLWRECEGASAGVLTDRRTGHVGLDLTTSRENQNVALILDYSTGHVSPPLEPTDDDQRTRNDVTVTAANASSARVVIEDGPLGVDAVGRYDTQTTKNLDPTEPDLPLHHAGWETNLGTVDKMRFPTITVNLRRNSSLVADWLALDIGSRIRLTNLPNHISYDDVDLIVEGYTEQISQKNWIITFNCAPYDPYIVGVLAEDDIMLLTAEDTTSTSWRIGSEPPFTKSADRPGDFPVALGINGEEVSATAAVAVGMNFAAGTPAHADNASVVCAWPSHVEGDLLVGFAAIRNTGVGSPNLPAGYTSIYAPTSQRIFGKYATSSAEPNPTVTFSGGAAGDTCSVVPLRLRGLQIDLVNSKEQSNGSAQDVAIPHFVQEGDVQVLLFWWKQDDMTSATPPTGISNELVEATTTTGNDQTLYVAYQNTASDAAPVPAGSSVVTGGAAAVSRATILALRRGVTDLTVERSVNGVVTSHAQLSAFEVHEPMNLAL